MSGRSSHAIKSLIGARAFPPLMIVMFHFSEGHHYSGVHWFDLMATRGYLWVEFFFALSGFILTYSYEDKRSQLFRTEGYSQFLRARLIRLYPLHLFMLLVLLAMVVGLRLLAQAGGYLSIFDAPYHQDVSFKGFIASLFLVHAWNLLHTLTWNGVSWFVSVEFALCLLFPLFLWFAKSGLWRGLLLIAAGLGGLFALLTTSKHGLDITYHNGVLRGLSDFAIGVGMAVLFRTLRNSNVSHWVHSLMQMSLMGLLVYAMLNTGWSHTRMDIFTVLPMMALVFALAFDRGILAELLKTKLPRKLGEWSYAVYLGQTTWLLGLRFFEQRFYPAPDSLVFGMPFSSLIWWLEPLCLVLVCILWGGLLAQCVELPIANLLRSKFASRFEPAKEPSQAVPIPE